MLGVQPGGGLGEDQVPGGLAGLGVLGQHLPGLEPGMVRTGFFDSATRVPVSAPYWGGPADRPPVPPQDMTATQENTVAALIDAVETGTRRTAWSSARTPGS